MPSICMCTQASADFDSPWHDATVSLCAYFVSTLLLSVCARTLSAHCCCQSVCGLRQPMHLSVCVQTSPAHAAVSLCATLPAGLYNNVSVCGLRQPFVLSVCLCAEFVSCSCCCRYVYVCGHHQQGPCLCCCLCAWCCQSMCGHHQLSVNQQWESTNVTS